MLRNQGWGCRGNKGEGDSVEEPGVGASYQERKEKRKIITYHGEARAST